MKNLFSAFFFKLRHDLTIRITLFIGIGLAVFLSLLYLGIDIALKSISEDPDNYKFVLATGQNLLLSSLSPSSNFGLAIPVNLITFTVLEFSQGSIRNKIIGGHSKGKIYASLCLNGLIITFGLMSVYVLLCFALGSICGGFSADGYGQFYFLKIIVIAIVTYVSITSFTIFFAALFRSIGPCIPVVILVIVFATLFGSIVSILKSFGPDIPEETINTVTWVVRIIDPLYGISASETMILNIGTPDASVVINIENETFVSQVICNLVYAAGFFFGGLAIFKHRDVK